MKRTAKAVLALAAVVGLQQVGFSSGKGIPSSSSSSSDAQRSPADMAKIAYNSGIEHKDKAKKLEEQMEKQTFKDAKDQAKFEAKVKDEYGKALKDFKKATDLDPTLFQAFNGMGFTLRKTGDAAKALEMYDKALQMAPGFPDAIEYRGEAYLALGRIDEAKQSYMSLFGKDRTQADLLIKAMSAWVEKKPSGVVPAALEAFDSWIKERIKLAMTTADMSLHNNHSIWK